MHDVRGLGEAGNGGGVGGFDHVVMKQVTKHVNLTRAALKLCYK